MHASARLDDTCSLPTSPPRFAPEEWSHHRADRNLDHAWGDSSPLELGRVMPVGAVSNVKRRVSDARASFTLEHRAASAACGGTCTQPPISFRSFQAISSRPILGFDAPSQWAAARSQAGTRKSHGGFFVMYRARVAPFGVGAICVGRKHTEPPCALDIDSTYEANRSRRCDATSFVRELHLSVFGEAASVGDGCPGVVPFGKSTAQRAVPRGIG